MKKENKKKEVVILGVSLVVLLLITLGITYAFFMYSKEGSTLNTIQTGNLSFVYMEKESGITLTDATPISDEEGKLLGGSNRVFDFSIVSSSMIEDIHYEIYATVENGSTLPSKAIKTYLTTVDEGTKEETPVLDTLNGKDINTYNSLGDSKVPGQTNGKTLYQETIAAKSPYYKKDFRFRMWITSDDANVIDGHWTHEGKTFSVRINVYAGDSAIGTPENPDILEFEDLSGANKPVLAQGMIPVVYSRKENAWVKQELEKSYDYNNQIWANAVTVKEKGIQTREDYMNAPAGSVIAMEDINTMWVWIPRYEYMYTNLGTQYAGGSQATPGEIKINFIKGTATLVSDVSNYRIPPAFTFGDDELEGIWYGKFETGGTLSSACKNESCNVSNVVIKPNVSSIRNQQVSSLFYMIRSMQTNAASPFGFSTTDSNIHMSKNDEWGSVAYLSQSKYGKYGNPNYSGAEKQVRINNCSKYITGVGASSQNQAESTSTCTANTYETANGMTASTTGNITGVYDMSGGANEYVMGVLADPSGNPRSGYQTSNNYHSGFTGMLQNGSMYTGLPFPDSKYYNLYTSTNVSSYDGSLWATGCNGGICYGHAGSETGGWYNDYYYFVCSADPWVLHGGSYSDTASAGVFAAQRAPGSAYVAHAARSVLVLVGA